jgi:hypothetical protein
MFRWACLVSCGAKLYLLNFDNAAADADLLLFNGQLDFPTFADA